MNGENPRHPKPIGRWHAPECRPAQVAGVRRFRVGPYAGARRGRDGRPGTRNRQGQSPSAHDLGMAAASDRGVDGDPATLVRTTGIALSDDARDDARRVRWCRAMVSLSTHAPGLDRPDSRRDLDINPAPLEHALRPWPPASRRSLAESADRPRTAETNLVARYRIEAQHVIGKSRRELTIGCRFEDNVGNVFSGSQSAASQLVRPRQSDSPLTSNCTAPTFASLALLIVDGFFYFFPTTHNRFRPLVLGNEGTRSRARYVGPYPLPHHRDAAAETDEKKNVD